MQPTLVSIVIVTLTILDINVDSLVNGNSIGHTDSDVTVANKSFDLTKDQTTNNYEGVF